jgi:4'-phosphopantetheinyl transferase
MRRETPGTDVSEPPRIRRSKPPEGVIDVWKVDQQAWPALRRCTLSAQERDRANRLVRPDVAESFRNRRRALRAILADYVDCEPEELELSAGKGGKIVLRHPAKASDLRFSLSSSGDVGLIAITAASEIGVDVEMLRPVDMVEALVRRYFAPAEVDALLAVHPLCRSAAFLRCWTRKEAVMKAHGAGMALGLSCIEVGLAPHMAQAACVEIEGRSFSLIDLSAATGYSAAVAAEGPIRRIRYWAMPS